jgi:hypothetical protein
MYHLIRGEQIPTERKLMAQEHSSIGKLSELRKKNPETSIKFNSEPRYGTKAESDSSSIVLSPRTGADVGKNSVSSISDLPPELIFDIIRYLDPVQAICFGLTNKKHYILNKYINHHPVDLGEIIVLREDFIFLEQRPTWQPLFLHVAIREFMKSGGYEYHHGWCIFYKKRNSFVK